MSSPNRATPAAIIPLRDYRSAGQSSRSLTTKRFKSSPETLLIPVALATSLAAGIPSTTFIELLRKATCRLWNKSHRDTAILLAGDPNPPEPCDAPEIAQYFATVLAVLGVTGGIICVSIVLSTVTVAHRRKFQRLLDVAY